MRIAVAAFYFGMGITFASWASRIPDVQQSLGLSDGELGLALFAIPAGQLTMMAVSGYLIAKFGSRLTSIVALFLYSAALWSVSFVDSYTGLLAGLFFFGTTANMSNIAINTQAVFLEKLYGRNIMSTFHGLWSMGGLLGGIIGATFANSTLSLGWHYLTILFISIVIILLNRNFLVKEEPQDESDAPAQKFKLTSIESLILVLGFMGFGGMFCEGTVYDWSSVYFAKVVKPDASLIRAGYIAGMAAMTTGRFLADRFVVKYGPAMVLRVCGGLIVTGLWLAVALPMLIPAMLGFLLVGFGISSIVPICYSIAGQHSSMKVSTAITLVSSISFVGFLIGPPIIGLISEMTNLRISLALAAIFGIFIMVLSSKVDRKLHQCE